MALWPYALRTANEVRNVTPMENQTKTPMELFAQVAIAPKLKHFHTFGCPTYILDNKLQGNQAIQKPGHLLGTLTQSLTIHQSDIESLYRAYLATIPRQTRRFLRNSPSKQNNELRCTKPRMEISR